MKRVVISLHDVAPSTLDETLHWRRVVADLTGGPVSLLVVPRYAGRDSWGAGPAPRWLRARAGAGDEPVLHGYSHLFHDGRDGRELAGRDPRSIRSLIADGVRELRAAGVVADGFIAPSYAHPACADDACRSAGLAWWATRARLRSGDDRDVLLPSIGLGASTAPRRVLSPGVARLAARALAAAPVVRLDLHPADVRDPRLATAGRELLRRLLGQGRRPVTHDALLADAASASGRPLDAHGRAPSPPAP